MMATAARAGACLRAASALQNTASAATSAGASGRLLASTAASGGSGEEPRDAAGSLAHGRGMKVQAPLPAQAMADPAAQEPTGLEWLSEKAQDLLRPSFVAGHPYHYAEDTARAVVREQEASGRGVPGVETLYAPEGVGASDNITAPKSWDFSNRRDQKDEERQAEVAAQNPGVA